MAEWQTPKTDWAINPKNPTAEDFNRIEGNIDFLKQDIETKKGAIVNALNTVGLETELTDTHAQIASKIIAANQGAKISIANAIGSPASSSDTFSQLASHISNGKTQIASAITGKGVTAAGSDTFAELAGKIGEIATIKFQSGIGGHVQGVRPFTIIGLPFKPSFVALHFPRYDWGGTGSYSTEYLLVKGGSFDQLLMRYIGTSGSGKSAASGIIFTVNGFVSGGPAGTSAAYNYDSVKWVAVGS